METHRREPIFGPGIFALIIAAVVAWPSWGLMQWLMPWLVRDHPVASQTLGYFLLGFSAIVFAIIGIAAVRK
jgi:hypothetical protein